MVAQLSDLHCNDPRFDAGLMQRAIDSINEAQPDLVCVPGDLTVKGYRDEFECAAHWLEHIVCERLIVVPGNHDERNVGWE
ncbi:MAG: metallophosphoesterase, partial [Coriobacteriales bacterium]|nr:metallophosphoesterase [Coriobacteriales bacterium]